MPIPPLLTKPPIACHVVSLHAACPARQWHPGKLAAELSTGSGFGGGAPNHGHHCYTNVSPSTAWHTPAGPHHAQRPGLQPPVPKGGARGHNPRHSRPARRLPCRPAHARRWGVVYAPACAVARSSPQGAAGEQPGSLHCMQLRRTLPAFHTNLGSSTCQACLALLWLLRQARLSPTQHTAPCSRSSPISSKTLRTGENLSH